MRKFLIQNKAKGKVVQEEPPANHEEIKQLTLIAEKVKQYREDNPGIEHIPENYLMQILAIKIKSHFEHRSDEEILENLKESIRKDIFKPAEEKIDPKTKGKGPTKEELEEEANRYKKVQPLGYMITGLPNNSDVLIQYEKVFNGYTSKSELEITEYEKSRAFSNRVFP